MLPTYKRNSMEIDGFSVYLNKINIKKKIDIKQVISFPNDKKWKTTKIVNADYRQIVSNSNEKPKLEFLITEVRVSNEIIN